MNLGFLKNKTVIEPIKTEENTTPNIDEKEVMIEINDNSNHIKKETFDDKSANYNQILFNYKNFNYVNQTDNGLKRKNAYILDNIGNNKIMKKQDWIVKDMNEKSEQHLSGVKKEISSNENSCFIPIERSRDADSSKNSLSVASDIQSGKLENNFGALKDYNDYFKKTKKEPEFSKSKLYDFELKTIEEDTDFYELKGAKKRNSNQFIPADYKKKTSPPKKFINYRVKKEREKLQGYRCEICENVNDIVYFSFMKLWEKILKSMSKTVLDIGIMLIRIRLRKVFTIMIYNNN